MKITYVGWVGNDNLGDEALYQVSQRLFVSHKLIANKSDDCRALIWGGGTLHPQWLSTVRPSQYNYAFGVGLHGMFEENC